MEKLIAQEKSLRKIALKEDDFLLLRDINNAMRVLVDKFDQILKRHTVRNYAWKGQIIPFKRNYAEVETLNNGKGNGNTH